MRMQYTLLLFASLLLASLSASASYAGVNTLLRNYNVSASIINTATFTNITYLGHTYVLVYSAGKPYFLVNTTGASPTVVLNASSIQSIITPILSFTAASLNFTPLSRLVNQYLNSSSGPVNDCLTETGLNVQGTSCTLSNNCASCSEIPACNLVLSELGGAGSPLGLGIMQFGQQYGLLQSNVSIFNAATSNASAAGALNNVQKAFFAVSQIESLTQAMGNSTIFPPPASSNYAACNPLGSSLGYVMPWYCSALGYCEFLTYNTSLYTPIQNAMNTVNAQLPTAQNIASMAVNISNTEGTYILPTLTKQKLSVLSVVLNTTLQGLPGLQNRSTLLLTHLVNATMSSELAGTKQNLTNLRSNYLTLNVTSYSAGLASQYAALASLYAKANASYSAVLSLARSNTAALIAAQLNGDRSNQTASLAFREQQYNQQLNGQISNLPQALSNLTQISSKIPSLSNTLDLSPEALVRGIDGPFIAFMSSALGLSYPATVQMAPLLAALLSFLIGLVILAIMFVQYQRLKARKRLHLSHRTARAWHMFFGIVFILVLAYVGVTYVVASAANASAPAGAFTGALHSSHTVVIAVNGTAASLSVCASEINSYARQYNYTSNTIYFTGSACTPTTYGSGIPENVSQCMNQYARTNTPVVLLSATNVSSMSVYGLYGTVMRASGNSAFMDSCYAGFFIR